MATQRVLEKKFIMVDGNIVIEETVEKVLTMDDLQREKTTYQQRQLQIIQQMENLKSQYEEMATAIIELDTMISSIPSIQLPTLK